MSLLSRTVHAFGAVRVFSRVTATLQPTVCVGQSISRLVGQLVRNSVLPLAIFITAPAHDWNAVYPALLMIEEIRGRFSSSGVEQRLF